MDRHFMDMQKEQWLNGRIFCGGLDPVWEKIPEYFKDAYNYEVGEVLYNFACRLIEAAGEVTGAFKPNLAFWAKFGEPGLRALRFTIQFIHKNHPEIPVILDAKIGDIGKTNEAYVQEVFVDIGADAVTVHPYLGKTAMMPFLKRKQNGVIVLCRTSNEDAGEFQDLPTLIEVEEEKHFQRCGIGFRHVAAPGPKAFVPFYQHVAYRVSQFWNDNGNCGLVTGATYPDELGFVRKLVGDIPQLIPGLGGQSKTKDMVTDVRMVVANGANSQGFGMIPNVSGDFMHASDGKDFAEAAYRKGKEVNDLFNQFRLQTATV